MITAHPSFVAPRDQHIRTWRYMDLVKFLWMLQNSALYFARLDCFVDPYEGYYTKPMLDSEEAFVASAMRDVERWKAMLRAEGKTAIVEQMEAQDLEQVKTNAKKAFHKFLA